MAKRLKIVGGLERLRSPRYPSESEFVDAMNAQVKALTDDLIGIMEQVGDVTPEICLEALEPTFEKSKVYCPKDTHDLVNSGYLEIVKRGKQPYVEMGYAKGGKPRYAPYVHEMLNYRHEAPTRAKWLQHAVQEDFGQIQTLLSQGYAEFLAGKAKGKSRSRKGKK